MLLRYWQWTSGPAAPADTGLPFGPLRYRAWTNGDVVVPPIVPPITTGGGFALPIPRGLFGLRRSRRLEEDEIVIAVITAFLHIRGKRK